MDYGRKPDNVQGLGQQQAMTVSVSCIWFSIAFTWFFFTGILFCIIVLIPLFRHLSQYLLSSRIQVPPPFPSHLAHILCVLITPLGLHTFAHGDQHPHRAPARDHLNELPCGAAPDGHRRLDSHQSQFPLNADVERAGHARKKAIGRASDVPAVRGALETAREEARKSGRHGVRLILRLGLGDGGRHNLWEYGRCSGCSLRRQDRLMRKRQLIRAEEEVVVLQDGEGGRFRPLGTLRAPMPKHGHICKFVADCGYYRILD